MELIPEIYEFLDKTIRFYVFGTRFEFALPWLGVALGVTTFLIAVLFGSAGRHSVSSKAVGFIKTVITAPIIEEIIFRLVLISILIAIFDSTIIAVGISAFLFALGHVLYGGMRFVDSFVTGLLYGWAFVNIGLGITIIAHMTHNLFASAFK